MGKKDGSGSSPSSMHVFKSVGWFMIALPRGRFKKSSTVQLTMDFRAALRAQMLNFGTFQTDDRLKGDCIVIDGGDGSQRDPSLGRLIPQ